ncbi:MAG TPA: flagellar protein FlaG [Candidatus Acidoferrum sp.]|nr:flagellar protein FlaG [Candidatus Acidoferrum sp.]
MDVQTIDPGTQTAAPAPPSTPASHGTLAAREVPVEDPTLHQALSQLAGRGANVSVSFRVTHHPNEIVTVFRNADTGEEIVQFPPETMILIAQLFDKLAGAVLDRTA